MRVVELTSRTWPLPEELFGPNGAQSGCRCTWFLQPNAGMRAGGSAGKEELLRARVLSGVPVGLLAVDGERPVVWAAVAPRPAYPRWSGTAPTGRSSGSRRDRTVPRRPGAAAAGAAVAAVAWAEAQALGEAGVPGAGAVVPLCPWTGRWSRAADRVPRSVPRSPGRSTAPSPPGFPPNGREPG